MIVFIFIVVIVAALLATGVGYLPAIQQPFKNILMCLIFVGAALIIAQHAGIL